MRESMFGWEAVVAIAVLVGVFALLRRLRGPLPPRNEEDE